MVNIKLKYNFVDAPHKFIIPKLSIHKLRSSSELIIILSLQIESFAIVNLHGVGTKLHFNFTKKEFVAW